MVSFSKNGLYDLDLFFEPLSRRAPPLLLRAPWLRDDDRERFFFFFFLRSFSPSAPKKNRKKKKRSTSTRPVPTFCVSASTSPSPSLPARPSTSTPPTNRAKVQATPRPTWAVTEEVETEALRQGTCSARSTLSETALAGPRCRRPAGAPPPPPGASCTSFDWTPTAETCRATPNSCPRARSTSLWAGFPLTSPQ